MKVPQRSTGHECQQRDEKAGAVTAWLVCLSGLSVSLTKGGYTFEDTGLCKISPTQKDKYYMILYIPCAERG